MLVTKFLLTTRIFTIVLLSERTFRHGLVHSLGFSGLKSSSGRSPLSLSLQGQSRSQHSRVRVSTERAHDSRLSRARGFAIVGRLLEASNGLVSWFAYNIISSFCFCSFSNLIDSLRQVLPNCLKFFLGHIMTFLGFKLTYKASNMPIYIQNLRPKTSCDTEKNVRQLNGRTWFETAEMLAASKTKFRIQVHEIRARLNIRMPDINNKIIKFQCVIISESVFQNTYHCSHDFSNATSPSLSMA